MNIRNNKILIILLLSPIFAYSQQLELPPPMGGEIEHHTGYSLEYNENTEQPYWVAYELTAKEVSGTVKRKNAFRPDPAISTGSAELSDYKGSGYDRGHLAPAADMKWSDQAMSESFFMSNMSPQNPSFNRGIWKKLEDLVREWAVENDKILIATGPIFQGSSYKTMGANNVAVPTHYYKVILDYTQPELKGIGFILANEKGSNYLQEYAYSIDQVEKVTGIDFFYQLPDDIEESLESQLDLQQWSWSRSAVAPGKTIQKQPVKTENSAVPAKYWMNSSSNIRHNPGCRYYGKTKNGYYTDEKIGKPCGICGG